MADRPGSEEGFEDSGDLLQYGSPKLLAYRLRQVELRVKELEDKVDALVKTLVGSVLSIAVMLTIYVMTAQGGS